MILDNNDDLNKARTGGQAVGVSNKVDTGCIELERVYVTPLQP